KRLRALPIRPPEPARVGRTRKLKRRLDRVEIDQIIAKYESGVSTNQLMTQHHLAKRTISGLLRANGVAMRRQGLTVDQAREAADLYQAGRSLAWIAVYVGGFSPTTVARALKRQGVSLRPRPGIS
ncbi:MAG: helix-turn-helix domain-containing protein, partial [Mycobacterium sp.]